MNKPSIATAVAHTLPADVRAVLLSSPSLYTAWNNLTPLARNEWICWIISAKKPETREKRKTRMTEQLVEGKKRPCCFAGCTHR